MNVAFYVILSAALFVSLVAGLFFLGVISADFVFWLAYVILALLIIILVRWRFK